ncbi:myocardin-related transcription factor A isoform X3 [Phymastichus coffea]|uniref:myocardin-related transcription factor A isoform X3 n=1 Tax=Phymastichus coffea TaxID=108790 RepID=UPI00273CB8FF|nr:myocardin-related transcription factor A isoform X3 [Phymastichus coffea]
MPEPRAKRCKHCDESGHSLDSGSPFWRIQLDQDLLDTISSIYPEWFKDYTSSRASSSGPNASTSLPLSGNSGSSTSSNSPGSSTSSSSSSSTSSSSSSSNSSSSSSSSSSSPCSSNGGSSSTSIAGATAAPADSTSEPRVKHESSPRRIGKTESKLKSKLKKIEGLIKGRKDKREREIKEESRAAYGYKSTPKLFPSKDKVADIVLKKIANGAKMAEGNQSPPKVEVDDSPLQQAMERNKESLKVKLMLRRPYNQLVAQGIMPPLKTPPAFHEQAKQLERRKTGDLLKQKIQRRPGRDELVRQHILEAESHVDPSIAEKHRQLKKAKLADQLNDQLSHRPGPLELIQKNILHTEEPIERAVKEGHIPFKATSEGQVTKPQHPDHYITFEDDSQSSEGGAASPAVEAAGCSPAPSTASTASASAAAAPLARPVSGDAASPIVVSLSLPVSECSAVAVVGAGSPVFQSSRSCTLAELCSGVVAGPELPAQQQQAQQQQAQQQQAQQQQPQQLAAAAPVADSPLFISIASPAGSMSSTTLLPLAPAPSPMSLGSTTSSLSPLSNISIASPPAPPAAITPRPQPSPIAAASGGAQQRSDAPGKDKNRKKSKTKSQPKARTIKFHEYKGPPNAQKSNDSTSGLGSAQHNETKYEILLQQQQLFLQWQVEGNGQIHHQPRLFPQLILPASQKPPISLTTTSSVVSDSASLSGMSVNAPSPAPSNASSSQSEQPPLRPLGKLEDMKVSDLKVELKRRNLPVSGSKPQLIERLKPFTESSSSNATANTNGHHVTHGHILMDTPAPMSVDDASCHSITIKDEPIPSPRSDSSHGSEHDDSSSPPGDKKLKEHYRKKIEILQRELSRVQSQPQNPVRGVEKLMLQQHIHNKIQQQELTRQLQQLQQLHQQAQQQQLQSQQAQQIALQQLSTKANLAAFLQAQPNNATIIDSATLTAINNKKNQSKNGNATTTTVQVPAAIVLNLAKPNLTKLNGSIIGALVAQAHSQQQLVTASVNDVKPPPPQYDEAAKLLKVKIEPAQKGPVKSQMIDDVLEILINNGELPPSAAQEPVTPTTPSRQLPQGLVLSAADSATQSLVFAAASPMEVTQSECPSPAPSQQQQQEQPPRPPPLPLATFSVQLASELYQQQQQQHHHHHQQQQQQQHRQQQQQQQQHRQQQQQRQQHERLTSFATELLSGESDLEATMLLSPQLVQHDSPDPQPPQEVTSSDNANLDLKEFGIDFDNMDFSQLECDFGVKINESSQEFMDIGDVPMDMDSEWLDLINPSPQSSVTTTISVTTPTTNQTIASSSSQIHNDIYDPMLANSQDTFEDIFDPDFKMAGDLSLNWDNGQADFAT